MILIIMEAVDHIFRTEPRTFSKRFRKKFLPPFLVVSVILLYCLIRKNADGFFVIYGILGMGIFCSIYYFFITRVEIHEVRIKEKSLTIIGYDLNKIWEEQLDIDKCSIKFHTIPSRSRDPDYYLTLTTKSQKYHINQFSNWDYQILLNFFIEFKKIKKERIIMDEKYFVGYLEKKIARELHDA